MCCRPDGRGFLGLRILSSLLFFLHALTAFGSTKKSLEEKLLGLSWPHICPLMTGPLYQYRNLEVFRFVGRTLSKCLSHHVDPGTLLEGDPVGAPTGFTVGWISGPNRRIACCRIIELPKLEKRNVVRRPSRLMAIWSRCD